jgi:thioredoxin reductase
VEYDTIIVGGGPAGLSAALVLGRCCRRVLVVDAGRGRNHAARAVHNFLTRDGIAPGELRRLGRRELSRYGVEFHRGVVTAATCTKDGFRVVVDGRRRVRSRTLLLATGMTDQSPAIPEFERFYGAGVHHCPYCDMWEYRGRPVAAYGRGRKGLGLAMSLLTWTRDVTVVTGGGRLSRAARDEAARLGIKARTEAITALRGARGRLSRIEFESGAALRVAALFFNTEQWQRSRLPVKLGCRMDDLGGVVHDRKQRTGVPGLYLAGDASRDVQFAVVAAGEGATAAVAINTDLQRRDRGENPAPAALEKQVRRGTLRE